MDNSDDIFGKKKDNDDFLLFCEGDESCNDQVDDGFIETDPEIVDHENALNSIMNDINASNNIVLNDTTSRDSKNNKTKPDLINDDIFSEVTDNQGLSDGELTDTRTNISEEDIFPENNISSVINKEEFLNEEPVKDLSELNVADFDALDDPVDDTIENNIVIDNQPNIKKESVEDTGISKEMEKSSESINEDKILLEPESLALESEEPIEKEIKEEALKDSINQDTENKDLENLESEENDKTMDDDEQELYEYEDENNLDKFELTDDLLNDLERINDDFVAEAKEQKAREIEEAKRNSGEDVDDKLENQMELKPIKTDKETNDILNLNIDNIEDFLKNNNKKICELGEQEKKLSNKTQEVEEEFREKDEDKEDIENNIKIKNEVEMVPEKENNLMEEKDNKFYKKTKTRDESNYGILDTFQLDEDLWGELNLSDDLKDKITKRIKIEIKSFVRDNVIPVLEKIIK